MKKTTSEKIIEFIRRKRQVSASELVDFLMISERAVFKQLSNLVASGTLGKVGKPPRVFYMLKEKNVPAKVQAALDRKMADFIEKNYLIITPAGQRKEGLDGFSYWCGHVGLPLEKTAKEYVGTLKKYQALKKNGLLDGLSKFKTTFKHVYVDKIFYLDFYSIERFGKTKLGQLLLYAKQSQNKKLMRELDEDIRPAVEDLIKRYAIDAVGFIPPTVKREVQFMKELEKNLHPNVKKISIVKIKTDIIVPQKTLNKLKDRIENAKNTIVVDEKGTYGTILLIDDAVGSGATLNETAGQIKAKGVAKKVIGLSITGSAKGFDVISEV